MDVLVVRIPEMFGGGEIRVIGKRVSYREEGVNEWTDIESLGGSVQVMMTSLQTDQSGMSQDLQAS